MSLAYVIVDVFTDTPHARVNRSLAGIESVEVGGAAVIVARGEFCRW